LLRVKQRTAALLVRDDSIIARAKAFVAKHFEPLAAAGFEGRPEEVLSAEERAELSQLSALILNGVALLTCDIRTANLMAAIDLEAEVNQFLFLHLSEPVVDHIDRDRKSTRLNSSHEWISYAVF